MDLHAIQEEKLSVLLKLHIPFTPPIFKRLNCIFLKNANIGAITPSHSILGILCRRRPNFARKDILGPTLPLFSTQLRPMQFLRFISHSPLGQTLS